MLSSAEMDEAMVPLCQHCLGRTMFSTMREYSVSVIQKVFVCLVLFGVVLLVLFGLFVCLFVCCVLFPQVFLFRFTIETAGVCG